MADRNHDPTPDDTVEWIDSRGQLRTTRRDEISALNDIDRQQLQRRLENAVKTLRHVKNSL